ncbi:MAG TPA: HAD-IIB family hydrolase [Burkholderiales bacterium]|nr:HAD-IIB family hydrolase [Burkholderiales bacterium]
MKQFLLCTDLDRTLIPNGADPESPTAREWFARVIGRTEITLAYVTGRPRPLIEQAIADFDLPQPDFVIADVGTSIYRITRHGWERWDDWDTHIRSDWQGWTHDELYRLLNVFPTLCLQEQEKQNRHKLSFYVPLETDVQRLLGEIDEYLKFRDIKANLIWSIDEEAELGLLDVLPARASKLHAIRYLMQQKNFLHANTVFVGDSGNDLDVLMSDIPAVLVANADAEVKSQVINADKYTLYIATGNYLGMNGNYSAGILEGIAHYWPEVDAWLREEN